MRISSFLRPLAAIAIIISLLGLTNSTWAQTPTSSSYSVPEYGFGTGSDTDINSSSYKANVGTGALGVGQSTSTTYTTESGAITPRDEYIEFAVNSSNVNLGDQSTSSTSTGTATFYVRAYVSSGYIVKNASAPPSIPSHTLASPSSAVASAVGTEQFGINVVANTSPATFGANPVQVPDGTFSFGAAASGYNTANNYKYVNGETIAQSTKSSGRTDFTISYILNISNVTPAGDYTMVHDLVAVAGY